MPGTQRFSYLFLPTVSWSFTTMVSSAPGSRGAPFRSHSKPWRGGERSQDQRPARAAMLTLALIGSGTSKGSWRWRTKTPDPLRHHSTDSTNLSTTHAPNKMCCQTHRKNMPRAKAFPSSWIKSEQRRKQWELAHSVSVPKQCYFAHQN